MKSTVKLAVSIFVLLYASTVSAFEPTGDYDKDIKMLFKVINDQQAEIASLRSQVATGEQVAVREGGPVEVAQPVEGRKITQEDKTGTDPRGFSSKFMPYYRIDKMENALEAQQFTLFGMWSFTDRLAMTYEMPIAKQVDYSDVPGFASAGLIGGGASGGGIPAGGIPSATIDLDGDEVGMGDLNLRLFYKPKEWEFAHDNGLKFNFMPALEMFVPTATEDALGSDALTMGPNFIFVHDTPTHGFIAMMNIFDFTLWNDTARADITRYRGRWFLMQPLTKPGPGMLSGLYLLPEFQPIYDFENSEFSFWAAPELGKMLGPGNMVYAKPGFGVDQESIEREWSFEVGWRYFL